MWIWFWLLFVIIVFAMPLGYGWGYRGWGAPYPSYYRRRRPTVARDVTYEDSWGWVADVVWLAFFVGVVWLIVALVV
jgi:hypothetical protein